MSEYSHPNFLETSQQDLQNVVSHEQDLDAELQFALDRACMPHCVEVIAELEGLHIPNLDRFDEYITFLRSHGAHSEAGTNNPEIYGVDDGWFSIAVADLLRINGYTVVSQNLTYDAESTDAVKANTMGRVRNDAEAKILSKLGTFGGTDGENWIGALADTVSTGGYAIASIRIPSSKKENDISRHTVLVTSIDDTNVYYFDPDKLAFDRYKDGVSSQHMHKQDESKLLYSQPISDFRNRMTGEVMHIWIP